MSDIKSRIDRLEARDAAREILLHALLAHAVNEALDGHAFLDDLRGGVDGILASSQWRDGRGEHAQAAARQEIADAFGRAANAAKLKERAHDAMASRADQMRVVR